MKKISAISADQLVRFREIANRALTLLAPDVRPGEGCPNLTHEQYRLIAGVLGTAGTAREVEAYVSIELEKWAADEVRSYMMTKLLAVVIREIELLEFYTPSEDRSFPKARNLKSVDDMPETPRDSIPIEEFFQSLENIRNSSVFKR